MTKAYAEWAAVDYKFEREKAYPKHASFEYFTSTGGPPSANSVTYSGDSLNALLLSKT